MQQLNESKMTFLKTIINFQLLMNLSQALSGQTFCLEINKSCFKTNKFSFTWSGNKLLILLWFMGLMNSSQERDLLDVAKRSQSISWFRPIGKTILLGVEGN